MLDGGSDIFRLLRETTLWDTTHRHLSMVAAKGSADERLSCLLPQQITGVEAICGGIEYRIACLSGTPHLQLKELIGLPIEIRFVTDRGGMRKVCGIVTEAHSGDFDGGLAAYHLVVRDALALLEKRVTSRIFRNRNELDIVRIVLDEARRRDPVLGTAFELDFDSLLAARALPPRGQTMQCNESDAAFVRRLLKRCGIAWVFRPGRSRGSGIDPAQDETPAHTLLLFDDPACLPLNAAGTVRFHREDATDPRDAITSWKGVRRLQPGSTERFSWDYQHPNGAHFMSAGASGNADQGSRGNALASALDDYLIEAPHIGDDAEDAMRLCGLRMARHDYETKCFQGEGNVRAFCAGQYFVLDGHPEIDTHPADQRAFVITELHVSARNNLPKDLEARAGRLLGHEPGNRTLGVPGTEHCGPVRVRFTALRRNVPIVPAFDPRTDLPHPQLQSAIVVGPPGEEVYCDELGRVKIRFPGMRAADHEQARGAGASDTPADSAWVRVISSWAGNGPGSLQQCGTLSLPRVGTEVMVAFLGGDPDKPIIVGQAFNRYGAPPALSPLGGLPGNRYLSGMRSREIGGARGNQLRFDDTRGQISAQLASDHGASELNLGWLAHPRADGAGEPRGEGAELRSDGAVAIRGSNGVLISAERSPQAEGAQLDRAALIGLGDVLQGVVHAVGKLAEQHAGDEFRDLVAGLVETVKRWEEGSNTTDGAGGGAPIVAVTAPAGVMLGSAENVVIGAEKQVDLASAGDVAVSAGGNIFVRALRGLSAFAQAQGIKLVAALGNVSLQTHHGDVEIKSAGRIILAAAEGIELHGAVVKIVAEGARTDWGDKNIVHQSAGRHAVMAAEVVYTGPGSAQPDKPDTISTTLRTDERIVLSHGQSGDALANVRYAALLDDGSKVEGVTDHEGRSTLLAADLVRLAKLTFFSGEQAGHEPEQP